MFRIAANKNLIKTSNKQKANKQASIRRTIHE